MKRLGRWLFNLAAVVWPQSVRRSGAGSVYKETRPLIAQPLIFALIPIVSLLGCQSSRVPPFNAEVTLSQADREVYSWVVDRLLEEVRDESNWDRRSTFSSSHLTQGFPQKPIRVLFPVHYGRERITVLGRGAVGSLLAVVSDRNQNEKIRNEAWRILSDLNDPRALPMLRSCLKLGLVAADEADLFLERRYPRVVSRFKRSEDKLLPWLDEQANKSEDELCLQLLDESMREVIDDRAVLRWMNWKNGANADEWLTRGSQRATAFRNQELKKGYDPLVALGRLYEEGLPDGKFSEGIKKVFESEADRIGCDQFVRSWLRFPDAHNDGWLERFRRYYWEHRGEVFFDHQKYRFAFK